jgi:hypothetical protein
MWTSFPCLHCHKLLRVHGNYAVRGLGVAFVAVIIIDLYTKGTTNWFGHHPRSLGAIAIAVGAVALIDEYKRRRYPELEPAATGSLIAPH